MRVAHNLSEFWHNCKRLQDLSPQFSIICKLRMSSFGTKKSNPSTSSTVNIVENEIVDKESGLVQNGPTDADDEVFEDDAHLAWGWRRFKPSWLQWLNSPNWFMLFLCWFTFLQGMAVNTFVNLALPTLEKRFKLNSKLSGFIISSNDITALMLVIFVSFYGSYGHKTKWLGYGSIVTGIASLIFTLPKFLIGKYRPPDLTSAESSLCSINATSVQANDCNEDSSPVNIYYMFFVFSQLLAGAGTTPLFTLGPAYIDENVHPKKTSWYLGAFYISFFLGPSVGSILGGRLLSIHVDLFMREGFNLSTRDPRWIGAWWLGSFVCGFILAIVGCILLGYPDMLPGSIEMRKKAIKMGYIKKDKEELTGSLKKILPSIKSLLTNWTFLCQALGSTFSVLIGMSVGPFIYKLLTGRYGASFTEAGFGMAMILLSITCGLFIGSCVAKKLGVRDSCKRAAKVTFFLQLIGVWGSLTFLIPGCEYDQYAGVDVGYSNSSLNEVSLLDQCNSRCQCSTSTFRPLCAPDGVNYYSPCFAGCNHHIPNKGFTNCSCLRPSFNASANHPQFHPILAEGVCRQKCSRLNFYGYIIGTLVVVALGFSNAIPSKIVTLRSVPNNLRAFGLGLQFVMLRLLAGLPGPVIIGAIIDETCTLWSTKCGNLENCLNYDYYKLGWIITAYGFPPQALSLLFFFLSWFSCKDNEDSSSFTEHKINNNEMHEHGEKNKEALGQGVANPVVETEELEKNTKF